MIPVFYSKATGRVRRWLVPDAPKTEGQWLKVVEPILSNGGLGVLYVDQEKIETDENGRASVLALQSAVSKETGLNPANDRYAVVKDGIVIGWIGNACEACGDFDMVKAHEPSAVMIAHDKAAAGWTMDSEKGELAPPPLPEKTTEEINAEVARKSRLDAEDAKIAEIYYGV